MADEVSLFNMALLRIGEPFTITDKDEDTHPARQCRKEYDGARLALLTRRKLNFAAARAVLSAMAPTDLGYMIPAPFAFRFPVPSECLRVNEVYDAHGRQLTHYRYENRSILTDCPGPLTLQFNRDVPELGYWDDLSIQALAARIAYAIAGAITGDETRKQSCWNEFLQLSSDGGGVDAKEDPPVEPFEPSWVTSRFGGARFGRPPNVW